MDSTFDGNRGKPARRKTDHSANGLSSRPEMVQNTKRVSTQRRTVPNNSSVKRTAVQKSVSRQPQKTAQSNVQRPVQRAGQKKSGPVNGKTASKKSSDKPLMLKAFIKPLLVVLIILLLVVLVIKAIFFYQDETELLIREVTIEAGTERPDISLFFKEEPAIPDLVSTNLDFAEVNIGLPQTVNFNIKMYGRNFACRLIILDTVAPKGEGIPQNIFTGDEMPDASACVTGIEDVTDVMISWKELPDMSAGGSFIACALLTDAAGNEATVDVPFEVTKDSAPPVIEGTRDLFAYIGDPVLYRDKVTVTDDYDTDPVLTINTDAVDLNTEGIYEVVYTAKDFSGNESSVTVSIQLAEKPEGYVEPEVVYEAAKEILDEITEPGMTEEEIALQIVWWCRYNIRFILKTSSSSWTEAAYNAFIHRSGNCYSTAYAVKALFDVAGIENMIIERWPYQTATHFWNYICIDGQWYHCDATWREGYDSYFFMYTTEELLDFWQGGWNGFQFKQALYPESAKKSVQNRIDYKNHTIRAE